MDVAAAAVGNVVAAIYRSAYDSNEWPDTIERLRSLFGGSKACLVRVGPDVQASDCIAANADEVYQGSYVQDFSRDPSVLEQAISAAPVGLVYADHALVGAERLRGSRFWNEWMAPQDMYGGIGCKLLELGPSCWFFDVQRGRTQSAFSTGDLDVLSFLAPHVRRSIEIGQKLNAKQSIGAAAASLSFGIVVVDANLRVLESNQAAEAIFETVGSPITSRSARLQGTRRVLNHLSRLVREACAVREGIPRQAGDFVAHSEAGNCSATDLAVSVCPSAKSTCGEAPGIGHNAVILIRKLCLEIPHSFEACARAAFDLTPKEAQIATALASGIALKQAAKNGGIAVTTARTHLDRVFRKTATRRQSELVALLKTLQPLDIS